jgi:hypothetical protein
MQLKDALEIVLHLAEDVALDPDDAEVKMVPAALEAARAQKEALEMVRELIEKSFPQ